MSKRKLDVHNIFEIEPYRSILNLLNQFQEHKDGLEQKHFRYALVKNHDKRTPENMEGLNRQSILEMEGFFLNKLNAMVKDGLIKDDVGKSRNNINDKIRRLLDLKVIRKVYNEDRDIFTYKISDNMSKETYRKRNIEIINSYPRDEIKCFQDYLLLYGIPKELYDSISDFNKDAIEENIIDIVDSTNEIKTILLDFINDKYHRGVERLVDKYNNSKLRKLVYNAWKEQPSSIMYIPMVNDSDFDHFMCFMFYCTVRKDKDAIELIYPLKRNLEKEVLFLIRKYGLSKEESKDFYDKVIDLTSYRTIMWEKIINISFSSHREYKWITIQLNYEKSIESKE